MEKSHPFMLGSDYYKTPIKLFNKNPYPQAKQVFLSSTTFTGITVQLNDIFCLRKGIYLKWLTVNGIVPTFTSMETTVPYNKCPDANGFWWLTVTGNGNTTGSNANFVVDVSSNSTVGAVANGIPIPLGNEAFLKLVFDTPLLIFEREMDNLQRFTIGFTSSANTSVSGVLDTGASWSALFEFC